MVVFLHFEVICYTAVDDGVTPSAYTNRASAPGVRRHQLGKTGASVPRKRGKDCGTDDPQCLPHGENTGICKQSNTRNFLVRLMHVA